MPAEKEDSPASLIGLGAFLIAIGVGIFYWLAYAEQHGGEVRLPIYVIFLYDTLGKWGAAGLFFFIGGGCALLGVSRALRKQ